MGESTILVNKIIKDIKIAEDKKALKFILDNEEVIAKTDGDCCSNSWIEHIELPAGGFPCKVLKQEDLQLNRPDDDTGEYGEVIAFYGYKITTDKGDIVIDYRNESNGYYGGNLHFPGGDYDYFYGGVYNQNVSNEKWINIE